MTFFSCKHSRILVFIKTKSVMLGHDILQKDWKKLELVRFLTGLLTIDYLYLLYNRIRAEEERTKYSDVIYLKSLCVKVSCSKIIDYHQISSCELFSVMSRKSFDVICYFSNKIVGQARAHISSFDHTWPRYQLDRERQVRYFCAKCFLWRKRLVFHVSVE